MNFLRMAALGLGAGAGARAGESDILWNSDDTSHCGDVLLRAAAGNNNNVHRIAFDCGWDSVR